MVVPPVEASTLPEVAVPLIMSGRVNIRKLRADVDDAEVADVRLSFLVGELLVRRVEFLAAVGLVPDSLGDFLEAFCMV